MTFTVGTITRCAGQGHYNIPLTFAGGAQRTLTIGAEDLTLDSFAEVEAAIVARLRSAKKEANAGNFTQTRTALEGKTFQV